MVLVAAKTAGKEKIATRRSLQAFSMCPLAYVLTSVFSRSHSPLTAESPSFARSTRSSRLRTSRPPISHNGSNSSLGLATSSSSSESSSSSTDGPKKVVVHGKPCVYHSGQLVVQGFGFLLSTKATVNKFGDRECRREERCGVCRPPSKDSWGCPLTPMTPSRTAPEPRPEPPKPTQIMTKQELEDRTELKGIALRTRLDDDDWLSDPANNIRMNHDELFDILTRAERLAKWCLWRWLRVNHPAKCKRMKLHYPSDMDFGRQRMESLACGGHEMFQYRHTESADVHRSFEDMIQLRNRVHHFDPTWFKMETIDNYLYDVQNLAVKLYDEESARSARDLRDRLRQGVEGVAKEIEALRLLTALPFVGQHPWQHHHVELFANVGRDPWFGEYAPSVVAAARDWWEAGCSSSVGPDIETCLAGVQRLENGGYPRPIPTRPERQEGLNNHQTLQARPRSASASGSCRLSFRARDPTRRGSFSFGGSPEKRSLF